jgi:hypothetical protein
VKTKLVSGAELDVLTEDELRTVLTETLSGYLREPYRVRFAGGGVTTSLGALTVDVNPAARPGFMLLVNVIVVNVAGYTYASPYNPGTQGALVLLRSPGPHSSVGMIERGYAFGGSSGGSLPCYYSSGDDRAIDLRDQERLQLQFTGGPASSSIVISGHGTMIPLADQAAY